MGGEEQKRRRRELHLPLSGERRREGSFPLLPSSNGRARSDPRLADTCSRPAARGGRLAPPGQSVFGKTQRTSGARMANGRGRMEGGREKRIMYPDTATPDAMA